jgi:thymidylate synthase ThyX
LEHAISKMLSHPLQEVREVGEKIKTACLEEVPTLVKYAQPEGRSSRINRTISQVCLDPESDNLSVEKRTADEWCQLVDYQEDGENKVLAAVICKAGSKSYYEALALIMRMAQEERRKLADSLLDTLADHEIAPRELEHTSYSFEILIDQGGYAEFKRHRMMTQSPQPLSTRLGYAVPEMFALAGLELAYRSVMHQAALAYEKLAAWNQDVASYLVPNGYLRRVFFTMNLREAYAFCRLRAASNAHFSLRRLAQRVAEQIRIVHPLLGAYMNLPNEPWQEIEKQNFSSSTR